MKLPILAAGLGCAALLLCQTGVAPSKPSSGSSVTAGKGEASKSDDPIVIRTTTKLIQINVVVTGKDGKPVSDLKAEDFRVVENGKPQQIRFFALDDGSKPFVSAVQLPDNVFTNRVGKGGEVPTSVTAIVLDGLNTAMEDQVYARQQVLKFLKQITPQDRVALFSVGRTFSVLHDYTSDASSLLEKLDRYAGRTSSLLEDSKPPPEIDPDAPVDPFAPQQDPGIEIRQALFATKQRVETTLLSLQTIGQHLAGVPGRKSIVWVTAGFPLVFQSGQGTRNWEVQSFGPEVDRVVRRLNDANVAVYPVDARGLMIDPGFAASTPTGPRRNQPIFTPPNHETMIELAARTGGRAFYNRNDVGQAVREAVEDSRVSYTLAYYASVPEKKDEYRKIDVEVTRPGVRLRHRKGYIATRETAVATKQLDADLGNAIWSPMDSTFITISGRIDQAEQSDMLYVRILVDPRSLTLTPDGDKWASNLRLLFVQKDEKAILPGGLSDSVRFKMVKAALDRAYREGLMFERAVKRHPSARFIKLAVADEQTGVIGTLTVPLSKVVKFKPSAETGAPTGK